MIDADLEKMLVENEKRTAVIISRIDTLAAGVNHMMTRLTGLHDGLIQSANIARASQLETQEREEEAATQRLRVQLAGGFYATRLKAFVETGVGTDSHEERAKLAVADADALLASLRGAP